MSSFRFTVAVMVWCITASLVHSQRREQQWALENLTDPKNSHQAVHTLAAIGRPVMPTLLRVLRTKGNGNRVLYDKTIQVVGLIGPDAAGAVPFLIAQLDGGGPVLRKVSIVSLGQIGPASAKAVPTLRRILQADQDMRNEFDITIKALEQIGPGAKTAYPELMTLIKKGRSPDRCAMAIASIGADATDAIPHLIERLDETMGSTVSPTGAARALGHFGPLAKEALPALRAKVAAADKTDDMNVWGRFAIAKIENSSQSDVIAELIKRLDTQTQQRPDIVRAFGELGTLASSTVPKLITLVDRKANSQPNAFGWHAIVSLGQIGPEAKAAVPLLIEIVEEQRKADRGHAPIRSVAMEALGKIGRADTRVLPALQEAAKSDPDPIMKLLAMKTVKIVESVKVVAKVDPPTKPTIGVRIWTDITGKYKIKASFVKITQRDVVLDTDGGKTINVPLDKLSKTDIDYISKTLKVKIPNSAGTNLLADRDRVAFEAHKDFVNAVRFSDDGKLIASGGKDETIKIWDASTGDLVRDIDVRTSVNYLKFSPNGKWLFSAGPDRGHSYLWDVKTGDRVKDIADRGAKVRWINYSPDSKFMVVAFDRGADVYDIAKGKHAAPFPNFDYRTHVMLAVSTEKFLMFIKPDGGMVLGDWAKVRRELKPKETVALKNETVLVGEVKYINRLQFSPDGKVVVGDTYEDRKVHLWDAATGKLIASMGHELTPKVLTFSRDSKLLAIAGDHKKLDKKGDIVIWDIASKKVVARFGQQIGEIKSIDFSPDGTTLAATTSDYMDSRVHLWNLRRQLRR